MPTSPGVTGTQMLKIKKLTVQYGPLPALYEISLEVKQGRDRHFFGSQWGGENDPAYSPSPES